MKVLKNKKTKVVCIPFYKVVNRTTGETKPFIKGLNLELPLTEERRKKCEVVEVSDKELQVILSDFGLKNEVQKVGDMRLMNGLVYTAYKCVEEDAERCFYLETPLLQETMKEQSSED